MVIGTGFMPCECDVAEGGYVAYFNIRRLIHIDNLASIFNGTHTLLSLKDA